MYYKIYRDVQGYWRWRLKSANHETIASGEGYSSKAACNHAIELVKRSYSAPVQEQ
jgi:uncharacterized protein YegP (UPF0339 family)